MNGTGQSQYATASSSHFANSITESVFLFIVQIEKSKGQPQFLGLHFPASDIPAQARLLYTKNRIRGALKVVSLVSQCKWLRVVSV